MERWPRQSSQTHQRLRGGRAALVGPQDDEWYRARQLPRPSQTATRPNAMATVTLMTIDATNELLYYNQHLIDGRRHDYFFLSLRTSSISSLSAPSSSSVHDASVTREVIICRIEPPKNVCKYCCSAVRLAIAGEVVAE